MARDEPFSKRFGYAAAKPILHREDLSDELRQPLIDILRSFAGSAFLMDRLTRLLDPYGLDPLPGRPDPMPVSDEETRADFVAVKRVLLACDWFRLYDLLEDVFQQLKFHEEELADADEEPRAYPFQAAVDDYFLHVGIGWHFVKGRLIARGDEAFEVAVANATNALTESNRPTAAGHIHNALQALSLRPAADLSGAVYHGMGALECVARDVTGDTRGTLGEILRRNPDLVPKPLDVALDKAWGFASDRARHVLEGHEPTHADAELIVGIAASVATYLTRKGVS